MERGGSGSGRATCGLGTLAAQATTLTLAAGGAQLPKLAKNLGKAQKEFKDGLSAGQKDADAKEAAKAEDSDS